MPPGNARIQRFGTGVMAGPGDMRGQRSGQTRVVADPLIGLDVVGGRYVGPGRAAAAAALLLPADRESAIHQSVEMFANGVRMHAEFCGQRDDRGRRPYLLQSFQHDGAPT
jgi:hypothetical protein